MTVSPPATVAAVPLLAQTQRVGRVGEGAQLAWTRVAGGETVIK